MTRISYYRAWLLALFTTLLVACDSGSSGSDTTAGIGGTGIVAGRLTDFGSVYVNGGIFDTNRSQFIVDGNENAMESDLAIGMVVSIRVETENGNFTNQALEVFYDDEVEGPVAAMPVDVPGSNGTQKTFTVFGQTITIDETGTIFEATTFDTVAADDILEISGFRESPTQIRATYVEKRSSCAVSSAGTVQGHPRHLSSTG